VSARPLVILNPKAGAARGKTSTEQILRAAEVALGPLDHVLTERPGHATALAHDAAAAGRALVIATGGDGSIHEVVNGLMRAREGGHDRTVLGIIGRGTGSDFCKTLGIEPRLDRFLSVIAGGYTRAIDVGAFRYSDPSGELARSAYFVNILSAGMGGLVDRYVHDSASWLGGTAGYYLASVRALVESEIGVLSLEHSLDGETHREIVKTRQIAICNGRFFGSGMHVAPMADPSDGVFEVIDLGAASKLRFAVDGGAIYKGQHLKNPEVRHFRCRRIRIELKNPAARDVFLNDADGEPLGGLPIEVSVVPGALRVLAPPP
jgi:YegS/Rv2252/BmrU family lipid kinase